MEPQWLLVVSAILFTIGAFGVLWNRGAITILMCIEIMLNAANLAFITFARQFDQAEGQIYAFFIMTLAAAEATIGLAIVIAVYRSRGSIFVTDAAHMRN